MLLLALFHHLLEKQYWKHIFSEFTFDVLLQNNESPVEPNIFVTAQTIHISIVCGGSRVCELNVCMHPRKHIFELNVSLTGTIVLKEFTVSIVYIL